MKYRVCVASCVFIIILIAFFASAQAEIHKMYFSAWTENYTNPNDQNMFFLVTISDTKLRAPDAIKSLSVKAPDGTVFDMTNNTWNEFHQNFTFRAYPGDFIGGVIPSGNFKAKVNDKSGKNIKVYDKVEDDFLDPSVITYPMNGSTVGSLTPTIEWTAVPGAERYRILLNYDWGGPIYYYLYNTIWVYRNSFTIPKGVLKPGLGYNIQIEAHDSDKDTDKRSRSEWVLFYTP